MAARRGQVEWVTVAVAAAIYGGWFVVTAWHSVVPMPLLIVLGAWLIAWHGSLQHETIHGHPTRWAAINHMLGFTPLGLWLPYALYHRSHVAHHGSIAITDPRHDPESRYVERRAGLAWLAAHAQGTLPAQMLLGPPIAIVRLLIEEAHGAARAPVAVLRDWLPHLVAVALLLLWLDHVGFGIGAYVLTFVYPGMALTGVRSFAEHRAGLASPGHAASVERGGPLALLFLNNNLHAAHHARPGLAWYALPAHHRMIRPSLVADGATLYASYGEVARRFGWRRHDAPLHPDCAR